MKASEIIKKNFTEEEFNKLLNSNNKIRKSLGWHTPPTGHPGVSGNEPYTVKPFGDELYKETPKQEDYVSLRNHSYTGKNFWIYNKGVGCFGMTTTFIGDTLDELEETNSLPQESSHKDKVFISKEQLIINEPFSHPPVFSENGEQLHFNEKGELTNKEYPIWTESSDSFYQMAHDYKDGKIDYRFIFLWFQEQHKKYRLEKL